MRGLLREHQSDFHWALRELQWKRVCIEIRDELLNTLGTAFTKMGTLRGEHPSMQWRDLATTEQVDHSLQRLLNGARFDEVLEPFQYRARA